MAKTETTENIAVRPHRKANIIVAIVVGITALILITIAVLCLVRVDPMSGVAAPAYYNLYARGSDEVEPTNTEAQTKIKVALDDMKFNVMSALLQWHWDYTYNFKRTESDAKVEVASADIAEKTKASSTEFMVEFVYADIKIVDGALDYSNAQSIKVDGETVYFDRLRVLIGDTDGKVGTISLYPYISARVGNESDVEGISSDTYVITGINVRANTSKAFEVLKEMAGAEPEEDSSEE